MEGNCPKLIIQISLSGSIALFLALAPILDPYILTEIGSGITIRINDVFAILLVALCFLKDYRLINNNKLLIYLCAGMAFISALSWVGVDKANIPNQIKVLLIWFIYAILLSYLWREGNRERFFYYAEKIAFFAIIILLIQFIFGNIGISVWDGKLPLLNLSKYDGWAGYIDPNIGAIRPNGIFQEPSYAGIYFLVLFAHSLLNGNSKKAILFAISTVFTSSLVAILSIAIITLYYFVFSDNSITQRQTKRRIIYIMLFAIIALAAFYFVNSNFRELIYYIINRIGKIQFDLKSSRMGSTRWRLLGNIYLFNRFNSWQKIFGYGTLQYASIFNVVAYSNNFVNILLNYGIFGMMCFIFWLSIIYRHLENKNYRIFFWCLVIIFAVDQQWFSWYFFYLLSACVLHEVESYVEYDYSDNSSLQ